MTQLAFVTGLHESWGAHAALHVPLVSLHALLNVVSAMSVAQPASVPPSERHIAHTESAMQAESAVQQPAAPERHVSHVSEPVDSPVLQTPPAPASPPASPVPVPEPDVCVDVDEVLLVLLLVLVVLECELVDECPASSTVVGVLELLHATANPTPITANATDADRTNMCLSPFGSSNDAK